MAKTPIAKFPILGKAVRVGPGRTGKQTACFWKFWAVGDEVYATTRNGGHAVKISIHASGQIHMHGGPGKRELLARPIAMDGGEWEHALQIRFLLSATAYLPPAEDLRKKKGYLIEVPENHYLILNVLVTKNAQWGAFELPYEVRSSSTLIWRSALRTGRQVVLTGSVFLLDDVNREHIRYMREDLNPRASFDVRPSSPPYMEVRNVHWSAEGGNVALVIPMGSEGYRVEQSEGLE